GFWPRKRLEQWLTAPTRQGSGQTSAEHLRLRNWKCRAKIVLALAWDFVLDFLHNSPIRYWIACFVIGVALASLARAEKDQPWSAYLFSVRYAVLYALVTLLITPALNTFTAYVVQRTGGGWIDLNFSGFGTIPGQVAAFGIYLFVVDFFYYWFHRAQHRFGWLWDQHSLHHSTTTVNVTTAVYHHWTEGALQAIF